VKSSVIFYYYFFKKIIIIIMTRKNKLKNIMEKMRERRKNIMPRKYCGSGPTCHTVSIKVYTFSIFYRTKIFSILK